VGAVSISQGLRSALETDGQPSSLAQTLATVTEDDRWGSEPPCTLDQKRLTRLFADLLAASAPGEAFGLVPFRLGFLRSGQRTETAAVYAFRCLSVNRINRRISFLFSCTCPLSTGGCYSCCAVSSRPLRLMPAKCAACCGLQQFLVAPCGASILRSGCEKLV
jgi:hypothetical protein